MGIRFIFFIWFWCVFVAVVRFFWGRELFLFLFLFRGFCLGLCFDFLDFFFFVELDFLYWILGMAILVLFLLFKWGN